MPQTFRGCEKKCCCFEKKTNKIAHHFPAKQFDVDLNPKKAAIKLMIQEELTKLAEEADDEDEDEEEDTEKDEGRSTGQES